MDSTADLPAEYLKRYDIELVPVYISVDGQVYKDQVEISYEELYSYLRKDTHKLTTSGAIPKDFYEAITKHLDSYDAIFVSTISSKLSTTFQSANIAVKKLKSDKVVLFDSLSGSAGLGFIGLAAAKLAEKGKKLEDIISAVHTIREQTNLLGYVDDLTNLRRSGRISRLQYYLAKLSSFKPILGVEEGLIVGISRARGKEKAINKMLKLIYKRLNKKQIYDIAITHADADETAQEIMEKVTRRFKFDEKIIGYFTPGLTLHLGLGTVVVTIAPSASSFG